MELKKRNTIILVLLALITIVTGVIFLFGMNLGIKRIVPLHTEFKKGFEFGGGRYSVYTIAEEEKDEAQEEDEAQYEGLPEGAVKMGTIDEEGNVIDGTEAQDGAQDDEQEEVRVYTDSELLVREKYRDQIVSALVKRWENESFHSVKIYKQGKDKIRIDVPRNMRMLAVNPEGLVQDVLNNLVIAAKFEMFDSEDNVLFDSSNILSATYVQIAEEEFGVLIQLDEAGKKILADFSKGLDAINLGAEGSSDAQVLSFKVDGEEIAKLNVTSSFDEGAFTVRNQFDLYSAFRLSNLINAGPLPAQLTPEISANVKGNSPVEFSSILIALSIAFVAGLIALFAIYKWSGIWASFAAIITLLLTVLGYATLDAAVFTYSGLAGAIAGMAVLFAFVILIANHVKESVTEDANPEIAAVNSLKATIAKLVSFVIPMYGAGFICSYFGNEYLTDFANMLMISTAFAIVGYFITYGIMLLGTKVVKEPSKYGQKAGVPSSQEKRI